MSLAPHPRRRAPWAVAWLTPLVVVALAQAQPDLYGPEAPADVGWVRVVNGAVPGGVAVRVGDAQTVVLGLGDATRYARIDGGSVEIDVGGERTVVDVEPEDFLSVAATSTGVVVVRDPGLRDVSRGLLGLLNLTDRPALDLRVPDGNAVVSGVPPAAHDALAVAEATTALLITAGDEVLARLEPQTYERGVAYTVVVTETDAGVEAFLLRASSE